MASPEHTYDVIVLGAGISGLYTARCLAEEGIDVLVLEARDRVGGRAWTRRDEQYDYVDMGGAYYGKQQTRVLGLAKELGLKTYNVPFEGHMIMYYKGVRHKYLEGGIPLGDIFAAMDANNILQTIDEYSKQFPIDAPWKAERAGEWDSMNVRQFLEQEAWTSASKFLIGQGFSIVFGKDAECVSFLYALLLVRLCGGVRALFGSIKGLQEKKIIGGSNSISEKMAEKLGGKVVLKSVVKSIHQDENGVTLTTEQNKVYKARHIVIAFSPNLYKFVNFTPQLPQEIKESVQFEDDYHDLKTITYYPKAYWREKGPACHKFPGAFTGSFCNIQRIQIYGFRGEFVSDSGPIGYALDDTKYDGQHPAIIGFVTDLECFYLPEDKRKERIANWYSQVFGIEELKNPIGYIEKNWGDEDGKRFAGDCVHTFPPGQLTKLRRLFGKPFDRVHFAGVETALTFRGYMDGGVRSGDRVTKEILDAMGKQAKRNYETVPEEIPYLAPDMLERFLFSIPQLLYLLAALVAVLAINVAWFKYGFL